MSLNKCFKIENYLLQKLIIYNQMPNDDLGVINHLGVVPHRSPLCCPPFWPNHLTPKTEYMLRKPNTTQSPKNTKSGLANSMYMTSNTKRHWENLAPGQFGTGQFGTQAIWHLGNLALTW